MLLVLKFLGFEQHVAQVAERGNGEQQQGEHHGTRVEKGMELDAVKEVDRAVEEPEAGQASSSQQRNHQGSRHKCEA